MAKDGDGCRLEACGPRGRQRRKATAAGIGIPALHTTPATTAGWQPAPHAVGWRGTRLDEQAVPHGGRNLGLWKARYLTVLSRAASITPAVRGKCHEREAGMGRGRNRMDESKARFVRASGHRGGRGLVSLLMAIGIPAIVAAAGTVAILSWMGTEAEVGDIGIRLPQPGPPPGAVAPSAPGGAPVVQPGAAAVVTARAARLSPCRVRGRASGEQTTTT